MQAYLYSGLTSIIPPLALITSRLIFTNEEFAIFTIFILINGLVMLSDVGVTASIFKYLSKYLHGSKAALLNVQKAIHVGRYIKLLALIIILFYVSYLAYSWGIGFKGFILTLILVISANNRWHFAIIKTFLFSNQKSLFFWRSSFVFSLIKYSSAMALAIYNVDIIYILIFILFFAYLEIFYLKNHFNAKLENIYSVGINPKNISFEYMLGASSFLWVVLLQLDKIYFSIAFDQEYFVEYSLFLQLCTGFFIISSTVYSIYGKDFYGDSIIRKKAYYYSLRNLSSIFVLAHLFLWSNWIYDDYLEIFKINIFSDLVVSAYLLLMLLQPSVILLINSGEYRNVVFAYTGGIFIWLFFSQINLQLSWVFQALFILICVMISIKNNYIELFYLKLKFILNISLLLFFGYVLLNFFYNNLGEFYKILSIIILITLPVINFNLSKVIFK